MQIDARGQGCPKPVLMAEDAVSKIREGVIEVLVDNEDAAQNVAGFAAQSGLFSETIRDGAAWKVKIVKGYNCQVPTPAHQQQVTTPESEGAGNLLLVIGTDTLGKEEDLGKILMQGFFETMKVTRQLPHTMLFMNAGVKLTTVEPTILALLKEIEAMGVEIYSCGTCLKYYDLEKELKVGKRGTTYQVVEGMQDFGKVVWI